MQDGKPMRLGKILLEWRTGKGLGVRAAAKIIGVHPATLNRLEREGRLDGHTLKKVWDWIMGEL
jgi:transcriptional regulator with XRE-family HTH domain